MALRDLEWGEKPVLLVGIDWADAEHVYHLMDEAGETLASGTIPHTPEGLATLLAAIRTHARTQDVSVALETSQSLLVSALLDQGFVVYAINPKAVDRHRERFRVAGSKSDLRDAWVLATLLRTDRALYRPLLPDSEPAQELRVLTRDRAELVRTRTMLSNQLTWWGCRQRASMRHIRQCSCCGRAGRDAERAAAVRKNHVLATSTGTM